MGYSALGINQIENINYNQGYIVKMNYEQWEIVLFFLVNKCLRYRVDYK